MCGSAWLSQGDQADRGVNDCGDEGGCEHPVGANKEGPGEKCAQDRAGGIHSVEQTHPPTCVPVLRDMACQRRQCEAHERGRKGEGGQRKNNLEKKAAARSDVDRVDEPYQEREKQGENTDQPFGHTIHNQRVIAGQTAVLPE